MRPDFMPGRVVLRGGGKALPADADAPAGMFRRCVKDRSDTAGCKNIFP